MLLFVCVFVCVLLFFWFFSHEIFLLLFVFFVLFLGWGSVASKKAGQDGDDLRLLMGNVCMELPKTFAV